MGDGLKNFYKKNEGYLQGQIGNPDGADKPNKKFYDPRVWVRASEEAMIKRAHELHQPEWSECVRRQMAQIFLGSWNLGIYRFVILGFHWTCNSGFLLCLKLVIRYISLHYVKVIRKLNIFC